MDVSQTDRQRIGKRNFYLMIAEGALFWMAAGFMEPNTVVSVFINEFTGSTQLAGVAATLRQVSWYIGQFIMGVYMYKVHDSGEFLRKIGFWMRMPMWLVAVPLLLGFGGTPVVILFIAMYTAFFFMDGFVALHWNQINAHTLTSGNRGMVMGMQQFLSALVGLGSATAIKLLMDSPLPPTLRYGCIFGLCALVLTVNAFVLRRLKDIPNPADRPPQRSFSRYVQHFLPLWKENRVFRNIVYGRLLYVAGTMAAALIVLFGRQNGNLTPSQVSTMVYIPVIGQLCGGLLWGNMIRKFGPVAVMRGANLLPLLIGTLGIVIFFIPGEQSLFIPCALMVFLTGLHNTSFMGYNNALVDTMPASQLPAYLVLCSILLIPMALMPSVAAFLAEKVSYLPVFSLIILIGIAGSVQTTRIKSILPPRKAD